MMINVKQLESEQKLKALAAKTEEEITFDIINERGWRDSELKASDFIVPLTDHPKHAAYMAYRQELRDYPAQSDFPNGTRPVKP